MCLFLFWEVLVGRIRTKRKCNEEHDHTVRWRFVARGHDVFKLVSIDNRACVGGGLLRKYWVLPVGRSGPESICTLRQGCGKGAKEDQSVFSGRGPQGDAAHPRPDSRDRETDVCRRLYNATGVVLARDGVCLRDTIHRWRSGHAEECESDVMVCCRCSHYVTCHASGTGNIHLDL